MATAWKHFKDAMKEKRTGKRKARKDRENSEIGEQIVVQRLSSEVTGKAQKYSRIGPREFVSFPYEDVIFTNIKHACNKHFTKLIGENIQCDILAGEQGPSCCELSQIPTLNLIHVRFVPSTNEDGTETNSSPIIKRKRSKPRVQSQPSQVASRSMTREQYPKSLSVMDMLKLGKDISEKSKTVINLFSFDIHQMAWSLMPRVVEFTIDKEPFGTGGFRHAFKGVSRTANFNTSVWVIKKYLPDALKSIQDTHQTVEQHTKKVVQMHALATNFANQLEYDLKKKEALLLYGATLAYSQIFLGKMETDEYVTVEEYIDGDFVKYTNNDGTISQIKSEICQKSESLAHFSYEKSDKKLMVVDIQGSGYNLCDPEIASRNLLNDDNEFMFTTGNLTETAITNFVENHICNNYCQLLKLPELK
ncbi:transient receptor potential cation channel subfamily M member 6-like [Saccoglossus kowalevskii]